MGLPDKVKMLKSILYMACFGVLCTALVQCAEVDASDAEGHSDATAVETGKAKYESYFSDSDYVFPSEEEIIADFENSDPDFILYTLQQVNLLSVLAELHGISLGFGDCPEAKFWSGDFSRDLQVPSEYPTIQEAIDVAVDYQSVIVDPSTNFTENLNVQNKFINIFSAGEDPVALEPADPALPTILFSCGGGGMIGGFSIQGGSVGVKTSSSSLGMTTIVNSRFTDVKTAIVLVDTHFFIVENFFSGVTDGVVLEKATGEVHDNEFNGGAGISLYLHAPYGVTVSDNQFTQEEAGQGAIFMDGGAAVVKKNTFTLNENGFGLMSQFISSDTGVGLEILDNTMTGAKALGMVVLGSTGNTSQAYVSGNSITGTQHAYGDPEFEWLNYSAVENGGTDSEDGLIWGLGMIIIDAVADVAGNTANDNYFSGIAYIRSCGSMHDNTALENGLYDLIAKAFSDTDNCSSPTLADNIYETIWDDDTANDTMTMGVADEPIKTPDPPE